MAGVGTLLGSSRAMREVRGFARRAARVDAAVLLLGETGTGKTLLARVIHAASRRRERPLVAVNCAGIPESLFESEFFGYRRGAFTGAHEAHRGVLEQADGGTLLLDEVGELSGGQQAKLLTVLEDGEVRPLAAEGTVRVDVRLISATSGSLDDGTIRSDLLHRLAVLVCRLPALRERPEDIPLLARHFLRMHQLRHGFPEAPLGPDALEFLSSRSWPGNIRQLSHVLESSLILLEGTSPGPAILSRVLSALPGVAGEGR